MPKNIVIAAGGTGGHLFPAQALASELKNVLPGCRVLFMAKGLRDNPRFNQELFSCVDIPASAFGIKTVARACIDIPRGIWKSVREMKRFAPDVVIGFGSFHTFPVLCAASLLHVPMILHVADCVPGRVNRLFAPQAAWTGIFFPEAEKALKGTLRRTSIPLRAEFYEPLRPSRAASIAYYGLCESKKTVLVFGGSQGAKKLNQAVISALALYEKRDQLQLLHFTGNGAQDIREQYKTIGIPAIVREFESNMPYAWAAADLVISRSGACTLAEQLVCGVPSILIPFPYAMDQHQAKNARYFEEVIGGAKSLEEKNLTPENLVKMVEELLSDPVAEVMRENIRKRQEKMQDVSFSHQIRDFLTEKRE